MFIRFACYFFQLAYINGISSIYASCNIHNPAFIAFAAYRKSISFISFTVCTNCYRIAILCFSTKTNRCSQITRATVSGFSTETDCYTAICRSICLCPQSNTILSRLTVYTYCSTISSACLTRYNTGSIKLTCIYSILRILCKSSICYISEFYRNGIFTAKGNSIFCKTIIVNIKSIRILQLFYVYCISVLYTSTYVSNSALIIYIAYRYDIILINSTSTTYCY